MGRLQPAVQSPSVIVVFMLPLSLGYLFGGRLSQRRPSLRGEACAAIVEARDRRELAGEHTRPRHADDREHGRGRDHDARHATRTPLTPEALGHLLGRVRACAWDCMTVAQSRGGQSGRDVGLTMGFLGP